ncbi:hypothetical protein SprV_0301177800 [Sparganum proliferum]
MFKPVSKRTYRRCVAREVKETLRRIDEEVRKSSSPDAETSSSNEETSCTVPDETPTTQATEEESTLYDALRKWAIWSQAPHIHLNSLLEILRSLFPGLPSDAQTLLAEPSSTAPITAMDSEDRNTSGPGQST